MNVDSRSSPSTFSLSGIAASDEAVREELYSIIESYYDGDVCPAYNKKEDWDTIVTRANTATNNKTFTLVDKWPVKVGFRMGSAVGPSSERMQMEVARSMLGSGGFGFL